MSLARMRPSIAGAGLLIVCVLLVVTGCDPREGEESGPRATAPDFELVRLDGVPASLVDYRGQTVILDFWATWCAPCEVQMPVLDTLWKHRKDAGLMVLGVSVDTDPAEKVAAWVRERDLEYPIAIASQDLALDYGVLGFPTLVVVDPAGGIHTRHTGVLSRPELEDILDQIAREFPVEG